MVLFAQVYLAGAWRPPDWTRLRKRATFCTWPPSRRGRAIANGQLAPDIDPLTLQQAVYEAFTAGNGISPVGQLREDWYGLARQCGVPVHDGHGNLLPDADDVITRTVTAAIWFGITTGYLTLAGSYRISASTCAASQGWECCGPRTGMVREEYRPRGQ